jgi:hypothetical protein
LLLRCSRIPWSGLGSFAAHSSCAIAPLTFEFFRPLSSGPAATASNPLSSGGSQSSSRVASANGIGCELRLLFPTTDVVRASFCDARAPPCVNFNIGMSRRKYWTLQLKRPVTTLQQLRNFCCPGVALLLPNQMQLTTALALLHLAATKHPVHRLQKPLIPCQPSVQPQQRRYLLQQKELQLLRK